MKDIIPFTNKKAHFYNQTIMIQNDSTVQNKSEIGK